MRDQADLHASLQARLAHDHEAIDALLRQLEDAFATGDRSVASAAWKRFDQRLSAHLAFEDELLMPEFLAANPQEAAGIIEDHKAIRRLVDELGIADNLHETRAPAIAQLAALLRQHAEREDGTLYAWALRAMSDPAVRPRLDRVFAAEFATT